MMVNECVNVCGAPGHQTHTRSLMTITKPATNHQLFVSPRMPYNVKIPSESRMKSYVCFFLLLSNSLSLSHISHLNSLADVNAYMRLIPPKSHIKNYNNHPLQKRWRKKMLFKWFYSAQKQTATAVALAANKIERCPKHLNATSDFG